MYRKNCTFTLPVLSSWSKHNMNRGGSQFYLPNCAASSTSWTHRLASMLLKESLLLLCHLSVPLLLIRALAGPNSSVARWGGIGRASTHRWDPLECLSAQALARLDSFDSGWDMRDRSMCVRKVNKKQCFLVPACLYLGVENRKPECGARSRQGTRGSRRGRNSQKHFSRGQSGPLHGESTGNRKHHICERSFHPSTFLTVFR
jgi:hypothetical protein